MNSLYELYVRFIVWLGADPPPEYEYLFRNEPSVFSPLDSVDGVTKKTNPLLIGLFFVTTLTVFLIWLGSSGYAPRWTGLGEYTIPLSQTTKYTPAKTLWDWMGLLIIPIVLFGIGSWFNSTVRTNEREKELDRFREESLQKYIDKMTELLLENSLNKAESGDEARDIARVRTLTVSERLDGVRRGILLRFLYDASLISSNSPIVRLAETNLSEADLRGAELMSANLSVTNLSNANLSKGNLRGTDLSWSKLYRTNLYSANLDKVMLNGANLHRSNLENTQLREALLINADLTQGKIINSQLNKAQLIRAKLTNANLRDSVLVEANLYEADLCGANLVRTDMKRCIVYRANFAGADLSKADLREVDLSQAQNLDQANLTGVKYNKRTKWPAGFLP